MILALFLCLQEADRTHFDEAAGEVTLAGNNVRMAFHADPGKYDVITDLTVWRGRLVASNCYDLGGRWWLSPWGYSNGAQILEYSPAKDEWSLLHDLSESMLLNVRVVDDKLMLPEFFPLNERSRLVHTFDGKEWGALGVLPQQNWHVMDVLRIGTKLYVSGSWRDLEQGGDPNWWPGYGRVFVSEDDGRTWTQIRRTKENGRVLDMVEFQGKLYANEIGKQLISWDGKEWKEIPVRFEKTTVDAKLGSAHLMVFADKIVAINADLYYLYDGRKWTSHVPGYVDLWREGKTLYGLRENGSVWITTDAVKWEKVTADVPEREFSRQAQKGWPLHRGSVALHRGRLFVGTGYEGKIFAAPYAEKGKYVAKAVERDLSSGLKVEFEIAAPKGTSVKVRYRTAESKERLEKAVWKDLAPDVPAAKGHKWFQWRADFESDGKRTPVLKAPSF
jgi:hypothetical protein